MNCIRCKRYPMLHPHAGCALTSLEVRREVKHEPGERALVRRLLDMIDESRSDSEGRYPEFDGGCIECTVGTVPDRLNTGLCAYHQASKLVQWVR